MLFIYASKEVVLRLAKVHFLNFRTELKKNEFSPSMHVVPEYEV